jgi:Rieske Fe-S protein
MNPSKKLSKREFLKFITKIFITTVSALFLFKFLTPERKDEEVLTKTPVDSIPEGGALVFKELKLAVLKMEGEISAVSLTCTHLGCTVSLSDGNFACPCHGSVFDINGDVLKGPAVKSLKKYAFNIENNDLVVFRREIG